MKTLGLEIRKAGTVTGLFEDVDKVLSAAGVERGSVSKNVQIDTIKHGLQIMLQPEKSLYVSDIKQWSRIGGVYISQERMLIYESLHCVSWSQMLPDYRATIMAMILDDFRTIIQGS